MATKTSTGKKSRKKQKKVLEYTDGKSHDSIEERARDLDDILKENTSNPFQTTDSSEFEARLEGMTLSQMQELAVKASIFPSGNKTTLKNKLSKEFKSKHHSGLKIAQATAPVFDPNSEAAIKALEISNSGP